MTVHLLISGDTVPPADSGRVEAKKVAGKISFQLTEAGKKGERVW